jgi:peroxiredoxin
VTAVGISGGSVGSKNRFADKNDLTVPLLADPDLKVAKAYDACAGMLKTTKRAVIVIGEDGTVLHRHDHALGLDFQTVADLQKTLDELPAPA